MNIGKLVTVSSLLMLSGCQNLDNNQTGVTLLPVCRDISDMIRKEVLMFDQNSTDAGEIVVDIASGCSTSYNYEILEPGVTLCQMDSDCSRESVVIICEDGTPCVGIANYDGVFLPIEELLDQRRKEYQDKNGGRVQGTLASL